MEIDLGPEGGAVHLKDRMLKLVLDVKVNSGRMLTESQKVPISINVFYLAVFSGLSLVTSCFCLSGASPPRSPGSSSRRQV